MRKLLSSVFAVAVCVAMALGGLAMMLMVRDIARGAKPSTRPAPRQCTCGVKSQEEAL